jgi:cytoplasmic iron level regulating protein YaaA (DUF328/UPF0246 family)
MLVLISPAKTLDFKSGIKITNSTEIRFADEAITLINILRQYSSVELGQLMNISSDLAELNVNRFLQWHWPFDKHNSRQAIFAFKGEVYTCLDARSFDEQTISYSQNSLRILSGLYGLLRPLDAILPYRLEMGTEIKVKSINGLYSFWGNKITELLASDLRQSGYQDVVNLASNEYSKAVDFKKLQATIITPVFKDYKNNDYKVLSFFAKKARGWMARFILENRITNPEDLKAFETGGYHYNNNLSNGYELVFTRH